MLVKLRRGDSPTGHIVVLADSAECPMPSARLSAILMPQHCCLQTNHNLTLDSYPSQSSGLDILLQSKRDPDQECRKDQHIGTKGTECGSCKNCIIRSCRLTSGATRLVNAEIFIVAFQATLPMSAETACSRKRSANQDNEDPAL